MSMYIFFQRQEVILKHVRACNSMGYAPTYRDISEGCGIKANAIGKHVVYLENAGYVERRKHKGRYYVLIPEVQKEIDFKAYNFHAKAPPPGRRIRSGPASKTPPNGEQQLCLFLWVLVAGIAILIYLWFLGRLK